MPLPFPPRPELTLPKASGAPTTPSKKLALTFPRPSATTPPQQTSLNFPPPSLVPVVITPPQGPSLMFPRPVAPVSPQRPSPDSARRPTVGTPSLLLPPPLASIPPRPGTLTLLPPPGSILPMPPGLTLPPLRLEPTNDSRISPLAPSTNSPEANGSIRRKRKASEQEEAEEEPEIQASGSKGTRWPRTVPNDGNSAGRKSFEFSEKELAERAARKRLRTRWQTGCSEQDRARALNVALGKIGGARQYSWLNQVSSCGLLVIPGNKDGSIFTSRSSPREPPYRFPLDRGGLEASSFTLNQSDLSSPFAVPYRIQCANHGIREQTPLTPAQTMGATRARELNIHAGVIARELGISAEEVVDPPSPPQPPPVGPKPKAKSRPTPRPISGLKGPASAGHCAINWRRGGERLGHAAAGAGSGGAVATGAAGNYGGAATTGVAANTGDAGSVVDVANARDDGDENDGDNELIRASTD
ncbi:hypothetical protein DL767_002520 [Monosporascus sp. MG133]|nr:hypothetical protein DL767_002520 [Monosporascus sp. MG133]